MKVLCFKNSRFTEPDPDLDHDQDQDQDPDLDLECQSRWTWLKSERVGLLVGRSLWV